MHKLMFTKTLGIRYSRLEVVRGVRLHQLIFKTNNFIYSQIQEKCKVLMLKHIHSVLIFTHYVCGN